MAPAAFLPLSAVLLKSTGCLQSKMAEEESAGIARCERRVAIGGAVGRCQPETPSVTVTTVICISLIWAARSRILLLWTNVFSKRYDLASACDQTGVSKGFSIQHSVLIGIKQICVKGGINYLCRSKGRIKQRGTFILGGKTWGRSNPVLKLDIYSNQKLIF